MRNGTNRVRKIVFAALVIAALFAPFGTTDAVPRLDRTFHECSDCPEMIAIPGGKFIMGSPRTEQGRFDSEGPLHKVTLRAFALGKYDVTIEEFLKFLEQTGYRPQPCDPILGLTWRSPGDGHAYPPAFLEEPRWPATCLSWKDAEVYIAWLNRKVHDLPSARASHGGPYHLPSEAEWEYAARAGTTTSRWWGDAVGHGDANCNGCGSKWDAKLIAPVGSFRPNPFGLYDILGNVWQWVEDCWHENYTGAPTDGRPWLIDGDCSKRVIRGGSWINLPVFVRSAERTHAAATGRDLDYSDYAGFRVARSLP
jgi:formylglycine-generating enzyme required for sulfatase activity